METQDKTTDKKITMQLPVWLFDEARIAAAHRKMSVSAFVRFLLRENINQHKKK